MYDLDMKQKLLMLLSKKTKESLLSLAGLFSWMISDGGPKVNFGV